MTIPITWVMNQGRFRDYLNYLSMGPPSAQNWLRGWPLFNHGVHRFCEPANPRRGTNGPKSGVCYHLFDCRYRQYCDGVFANLPVALAPAMGLNAFFAFVVVGAMGISWQTGMGAIFWGAVGLFLLTLFRIRYWMISNIPLSLRIGITSGIGLFIALMGLKILALLSPIKTPWWWLAI